MKKFLIGASFVLFSLVTSVGADEEKIMLPAVDIYKLISEEQVNCRYELSRLCHWDEDPPDDLYAYKYLKGKLDAINICLDLFYQKDLY